MRTRSPKLLSFVLVAVTFCLLPPTTAAAAPSATDFIRSSCKTTRDHFDLCYSTFSPYANAIKQSTAALARVSVAVSHSVVRRVASDVAGLSREAKGGDATAISDCITTLGDALDQTTDSLNQLRQIEAGKGGGGGEEFRVAMDTVRTLMSAALTNEETCTDGFEGEPEGAVKKKVEDRVTSAKDYTGMALTFVTNYANQGSP